MSLIILKGVQMYLCMWAVFPTMLMIILKRSVFSFSTDEDHGFKHCALCFSGRTCIWSKAQLISPLIYLPQWWRSFCFEISLQHFAYFPSTVWSDLCIMSLFDCLYGIKYYLLANHYVVLFMVLPLINLREMYMVWWTSLLKHISTGGKL